MKNMIQNIQRSCVWQILVTAIKMGWIATPIVISLILIQPHSDFAAGGCTAPLGICSTTIIDM